MILRKAFQAIRLTRRDESKQIGTLEKKASENETKTRLASEYDP